MKWIIDYAIKYLRLLHYTKNARSFFVSRRYNVQTAQYWGEIYQIFFLCDRFVKVLAIMQQSHIYMFIWPFFAQVSVLKAFERFNACSPEQISMKRYSLRIL